MDKIEFFNTTVSADAVAKVSAVLNSGFLSEGKTVVEFEQSLTRNAGIVNPVTLNSGTAALHLALITAGIGAGDEVIIPAQTFIATGLAVLMTGATPVFADIQYETGNIDPTDVIRKINRATRAVIPVHWGGYPCDMDELKAVTASKNILIIEDAAHAIGARYKDKYIGSISDMTCFSFQAIKHVTTGDGGALACLEQLHFNRAMSLRWFGIDRKNSPVGISGEREYNLSEVGFKYHLNNYAAALGLANLDELDNNLNRRREIAAFYTAELKDTPGIDLFTYKKDREGSYWLFGCHVERRVDFITKLKSSGIPASVVHIGIHHNKIFTHSTASDLPVQKRFDETQVHIPVHNDLSDEQVSFIADTIKKGW